MGRTRGAGALPPRARAGSRAAGSRGALRGAHRLGPHVGSGHRYSRLSPRSDSSMKLKDKSALITGAASGIGRDIALLFAREGARVVVADLDKNAADTTAAQIRAGGGQASGIAMDVTDEAAVSQGIASVIDAFSGVDI